MIGFTNFLLLLTLTFFSVSCVQDEKSNENLEISTAYARAPRPSCKGSATLSCSVLNGTGTQTRTCSNGSWSSYSACSLVSCNSGYKPVNGICTQIILSCLEPLTQSCTIANGTGSQSRTCANGVYSAFSSCAPVSCNSGYDLYGDSCVPSDVVAGPVITSPITGSIIQAGLVVASWNLVPGAERYAVRLTENFEGAPDIVNDLNYKLNTISLQIVAGKSYKFWVHSLKPGGDPSLVSGWSPASYSYFSAEGIVTPVCTAGSTEQVACFEIANGTGSRTKTCDNNVYTYSTCQLVSCDSGFSPSGNTCAANAGTYPPLLLASPLNESSIEAGIVTASWSLPLGVVIPVERYAVRLSEDYEGAPFIIYSNDFNFKTVNFEITEGKNYKFWVHYLKPGGDPSQTAGWSPAAERHFSAVSAPCTSGSTKVVSCTIANGTGSQTKTCINNVYNSPTCTLVSCSTGYAPDTSGNSCVATSVPDSGAYPPLILASPFNGTSVVEGKATVSWSMPPGVVIPNGASYAIRFTENFKDAPFIEMSNDYKLTTFNIETVAGRSYHFWVHYLKPGGDPNQTSDWSPAAESYFTAIPDPTMCGSILNGGTASRIMYKLQEPLAGQSCVSENQTATCINGTLSSFSGTYQNDFCVPVGTPRANSITHYGITWTFSENRPVGKFANGESYVIGPVTITNISPNSRDNTTYGTAQHGSMINPMPGTPQGFDSNAGLSSIPYDSAKNVALHFPFNLKISDVLVSANSQAYYPTWIKTYAALTVLGSVPAEGSFRPSLYGTDRTVRFNVSQITQINWSLLKNIQAPSTPSRASILDEIPALPWFEYNEMWSGNSLQGDDNTTDGPMVFDNNAWHYRVYGRDTAAKFGRIGLWLNTSQPFEDKKAIAIRMIQNGIDIHDYVDHYNGQGYRPDGGHKIGRKLPLVFAAMLLGDSKLKAMASNPNIFSEDLQTFIVCGPTGGAHCKACSPSEPYVRAGWSTDYADAPFGNQCVNGKINDVARSLWVALPGQEWYGREVSTYTSSDLGMPEWGIRHNWYPFEDNAAWSATYRGVVYEGMISNWLTASLMGAETIWNHPPGFRYAKERVGSEGFGSFISEMGAILNTPPPSSYPWRR